MFPQPYHLHAECGGALVVQSEPHILELKQVLSDAAVTPRAVRVARLVSAQYSASSTLPGQRSTSFSAVA